MSVSNGQDANATTFNTAFMSRDAANTDTVAKVDLKESSTTDLIDTQRVVNEALDQSGLANQAATDANAKVYSSNKVITDGDNQKVAIGKIDATFHETTGHSHDGTAGNGPQIDISSIGSFNQLFAEFGEYTFDAASGTSIDVSSLFSSQSEGGDAVTAGVITSAPNNFVSILEKTTGGEIEDGEGDRVFARLTEAAGTWTLSFFTNEAGVETAHSLSSQDIRFLYREVFDAANRPTIGANVGIYDTQSAVGDIPDATATQRGVVSTSAQTLAGVKEFSSRPTTNSIDIVDISASQVITNKDIDGATASNTNRITLPKDTTANLNALTRKEGTAVYDTTLKLPKFDNGTTLDSFITESGAATLTNKDYDGGTASNTLRLTIPQNTTTNLNALTRKKGTIVYDTTTDEVKKDDGTTLSILGGSGSSESVAYLKEIQSSGVHGGTFTAGSYVTRTLNNEDDPDGIVTLSSNQFTLQAGTYRIDSNAPAENVNMNKTRLRNITDSTTTLMGTVHQISSANVVVHSRIVGRFTIASAKTFEIQHRCNATLATTGLGAAAGFGDDEVYTHVMIVKE